MKERFSSQTIDVDQLPDGDVEVEEFCNAAQAQVNFVDGPNGSQTQEFAPIPIDPVAVSSAAPASQEVFSLNSPSPAALSKKNKTPRASSKSPAPLSYEEAMSPPGPAAKIPSGSAGPSGSSGET